MNLNDCLDGSKVGIGELVELFRDFVEGDAVGDPDVGVDSAFADEVDDFREIRGEGVSGCEEGEFAAVEHRGVGEGEIGGGDAHENDAAGEGCVFETGGHGAGGAGGVDNDVGQVSSGCSLEIGEVGAVALCEDAGFDSEIFRAKTESPLNHVHDDDVHPVHEFQEFKAGEADGAGTDDENGFAGFGIAALDGVVADGEGLDEGELFVGKVVSGMEFAGGDGESSFAQAAIVVDADDLDSGAAVECAFFGGRGYRIVDVGFQGAFVSGTDVGDTFADRHDF